VHRLPACAFGFFFFIPWLSEWVFYNITLWLSLRFSLRKTFPDGAFYRILRGTSLAISTVAEWNMSGFAAFQFPRNSISDLRLFFPRPLTQPSNERLAFYRVDWTDQISLLVQTLTFQLRRPEGLNDQVPGSIKYRSPSPQFQSNLLSLTWCIKDRLRIMFLQLFCVVYINHRSTRYQQRLLTIVNNFNWLLALGFWQLAAGMIVHKQLASGNWQLAWSCKRSDCSSL